MVEDLHFEGRSERYCKITSLEVTSSFSDQRKIVMIIIGNSEAEDRLRSLVQIVDEKIETSSVLEWWGPLTTYDASLTDDGQKLLPLTVTDDA